MMASICCSFLSIVPTIKMTIKMSHRQETLFSKGPATCRYTLLTIRLRSHFFLRQEHRDNRKPPSFLMLLLSQSNLKAFTSPLKKPAGHRSFISSSMGIKQMHRQTGRCMKAAISHDVFADTPADVTPGTKAHLCHSIKIIPPFKLS